MDVRPAQLITALSERGWRVVRLWDFEIERNLLGCVERLQKTLQTQA